MGKGSNTTSTQSTSAPDPQAYAAYSQLLQRAQGVANTPYQAYTGQLTAPVNAQQNLGIGNINANANFAQPYVTQAAGIAQGAANPLTQQQIQNYQNPYTQDVVNATQAEFNNQNAQAQQGLTSNAIAQGALGGNRVGVAQGILAGQQQLAQAPTIAGLYNQSYNQGLQTAAQQYQQNPLSAAGALANFGISGQGAALSGAGAQLGAGTLQQQTEQQRLNAAYQQYQQAQAFPYQQTQWLAGLDTGVGSNLGGTSSGQTTSPAPNPLTQWLGLGVSGLGLAGQSGLFGGSPSYGGGNMFTDAYGGSSSNPLPGLSPSDYGEGFYKGGVVRHLASGGVGGVPWSGGEGWIPSLQVHGGSGPPHASAPTAPSQGSSSFDPSKVMEGVGKILPFLGLKSGGVVGYADGGSPDFESRFAPSEDAPFGEMTRGQGLALATAGRNGVVAPRSIPGGESAPDSAAPIYDDGQGPIRLDGSRPVGNPTAMKGLPIAASPEGEDEIPENATPTSGGPRSAGVAPAAQFTPPYKITPEDYSRNVAPTANPWAALTTAGLAMLANRSPFLGVGVGEGAMAGLQAYGSAEERDRKAAEDAQKLSLEAKKAANDLALQTFNANTKGQMTDYQQAMLERGKYTPIGSTVTSEGETHPLIMDQATGKILDATTGEAPDKGAKFAGKNEKPQISDEDAKAVAYRYLKTGDRTQLMGLGYSGANRIKVNHYIAEGQKELGIPDEELGQRVAEFEGRKAGQRTLGTMEAKMGSAAFEVEGAINLARPIIDKVPRTSFLPLNQLIAKAQEKMLNPDQIELMQRLQAIKNTYAAVMARGSNVTTDAARARGDELLSDAYDKASLERVFNTMQSEIDMAKNSPERMRQFYRQKYGATAVAPEGGAAPAGGGGGFTPPAGAIPQTHNGKTYYYDPKTHQPYPGQ